MFFLHVPQQVKTRFTSFPLVIATVARVSRKRRLWLVVRVNKTGDHLGHTFILDHLRFLFIILLSFYL